jgi:hypothetical protein
MDYLGKLDGKILVRNHIESAVKETREKKQSFLIWWLVAAAHGFSSDQPSENARGGMKNHSQDASENGTCIVVGRYNTRLGFRPTTGKCYIPTK